MRERGAPAILVVLALSAVPVPAADAIVEAGPPARAKLAPRVAWAESHDISPPLRSIPPVAGRAVSDEPSLNLVLPGRVGARSGTGAVDACYVPEAAPVLVPMPPPLASFEGVPNRNNRVPPDTVGDVGPRHFVQWVNLSLAIWDKSGALLYGPVNGRTLWAGFGGICETHDNGDPVVVYDGLADRWLVSQLAFDWPGNFHECIAVSETGDPTGAWYRYDFPWSATTLNDYPKFAVWPDAYYMAVNQFDGGTQGWRGQAAAAFERERMLLGQPARMVVFDLYDVNPGYGGQLPADLDGPIPPPAGAPAWFAEVDDDAWGWGSDRLQLFEFHVDWSDTSLSTFGLGGNPDAVIDLTAAGLSFNSDLCGYARACIPLPGGYAVDALSDRLMWRLAYRNFVSWEALTASHTVDVDGLDHAGIRWYEVRGLDTAAPFIAQAGTVAPDSDHRWMGSLASDGAGDMALGYSVASSATYPSIRYVGRLASDPPGTMPRGEGTLAAGAGSQTGALRWGDYSSMSVDPADDCTFWYTQEYYSASGPYPWQTRIGAFKFDSCGTCPLLGVPVLSAARETSAVALSWTTASNAGAYDVIEGDLMALRANGGLFAPSVTGCRADGLTTTSLLLAGPDPAPGGASWYLVRAKRGVCRGTLGDVANGGSSPRDAGLGGATAACP
jgi:hypothetical protein